MSALAALQSAIREALDGHGPLIGGVAGIYDGTPTRVARPFVVLEDPVLTDWSTKDFAGREGRVAVRLHDSGPDPARLRILVDLVEQAVGETARELAWGWRVASLVFVRSRIAREGEGRWLAVSEWRVRMLRTH